MEIKKSMNRYSKLERKSRCWHGNILFIIIPIIGVIIIGTISFIKLKKFNDIK